MKKALSVISLLCSVLFISAIMSSCSNSDDTNTVNQNSTSGNWRISYYFDNTDETSDFAGYTFIFQSSGVLDAVKNGTTVSGTWSVTSSKFNISFGVDPVLSELNDDWQIEEKTNTSIKLKDDNPAQDDRLQFTKL